MNSTDWSRGADLPRNSGISSSDWQPADLSGGYVYTAAMALPIADPPSCGDCYALSGRALVDDLKRVENSLHTMVGAGRPRKASIVYPSTQMADLANRIDALRVSRRVLSTVLGYKDARSINARLRGTLLWRPGELDRVVAYLDAVEAGR